MSLDKIIASIGSKNLANDIDDDMLKEIGERIKRQFDEDWQSMSDWRHGLEESRKLLKQEYETKSTPWEGASNYKDPLMLEGVIKFGDRASLELLRSRNLIKTDIIGNDANGQKKATSERVTEAMNYQVNYQMSDWRTNHKRLLYMLPNDGAVFKKTIFNPLERHPESHVIQYPDFAINQGTTSMEKCRSFTQIMSFNQNEVEARVNADIWREVDLFTTENVGSNSDKADGDTGGNEAEGTVNAEENPNRFLEQQCFYDLDDDGIEEPYIITIHESTMEVVRIVPRYADNSVMVMNQQGVVMNLIEFAEDFKETFIRNHGGQQMMELHQIQPPQQPDFSDAKLIRFEPIQPITKYGFIPSLDGTFLDMGYAHILGAITQALNATTNQLVDAGKLRNVGGGMMAKGFRKKMGAIKMKMGQWTETHLSVEDLKGGMLPNPSPEPSQTLFALNEKLSQTGHNLLSTIDVSGQIQANTAPTTALAIIQESLISTSALLGRIIDSQSDEFQELFRINGVFFDPKVYAMLLDEPVQQEEGQPPTPPDPKADFNNIAMDIVPTASAEMSSKMQRLQVAEIEMQAIPMLQSAGMNVIPILENYLEVIGSSVKERVFADPKTRTPQEQQQLDMMQQMQEQANAIAKEEVEIKRITVELLTRQEDRADAREQANIKKIGVDIEVQIQAMEKSKFEIGKIIAETALKGEEAETESLNNQINIYTTAIESLQNSKDSIDRADPQTFDFDFDPGTGAFKIRG